MSENPQTRAESDENERYNREVIDCCDHDIRKADGRWKCVKCDARIAIVRRTTIRNVYPLTDEDLGL